MVAQSDAGRVGVFGRSGSGKSSYVKKRIAGARRLVIFDPLGEYAAKVQVRHLRKDSLREVQAAMVADWAGFTVSYVPPITQRPFALSALCRLLVAAQAPYAAGKGGAELTLVAEELNTAFPVSNGVQVCPGFAEVCARGRHYGINVIGISQRVSQVHYDFRGNLTEGVVFQAKGPRDIDASAELLGTDRRDVMGLDPLHYLHEAKGEIKPGKITF